jgi:hypothetical protein
MGRQGSIENLGKTALADPHRDREGRYVDIERRVAPIGPHQSKISSNARSIVGFAFQRHFIGVSEAR